MVRSRFKGTSARTERTEHPRFPEQNRGSVGTGQPERAERPCPGCGSAVPPHRRFCRPSCRAKHEHRTRPARLPGLLDTLAAAEDRHG
jgi:hypothetical protein